MGGNRSKEADLDEMNDFPEGENYVGFENV
jgi:hypothetical protein